MDKEAEEAFRGRRIKTPMDPDNQSGRKEAGRLTQQLNGLQGRIEAYTQEKSWAAAWKERLKRFFALRVGVDSAASTYYLLFSLFPLIIFSFSLMEILDSGLASRFEAALPQLSLVIPQAILTMLQDFLDSVGLTSSIPFLSLSALGLLWAASRGAASIVNSMNRVYYNQVEYNFLLRRLIGIFAIFVISILLVAILILLAFYRMAIDYLHQFFTLPDFLLGGDFDILAHLVAFLLLTLIFTIIYGLVKRKRSYLRHTILSAMVTSAGWIIISYSLSHFIASQTRYYVIYGSITGIIFLMLWLYLAVYIILIGAFIHSELILKYPKPERRGKHKEGEEASP